MSAYAANEASQCSPTKSSLSRPAIPASRCRCGGRRQQRRARVAAGSARAMPREAPRARQVEAVEVHDLRIAAVAHRHRREQRRGFAAREARQEAIEPARERRRVEHPPHQVGLDQHRRQEIGARKAPTPPGRRGPRRTSRAPWRRAPRSSSARPRSARSRGRRRGRTRCWDGCRSAPDMRPRQEIEPARTERPRQRRDRRGPARDIRIVRRAFRELVRELQQPRPAVGADERRVVRRAEIRDLGRDRRRREVAIERRGDRRPQRQLREAPVAASRAASACGRTSASRSCRGKTGAARAACARRRRRPARGPACGGTRGRCCRARCARTARRGPGTARRSARARSPFRRSRPWPRRRRRARATRACARAP